MTASHRALIEDGPHQGVRPIPGNPQETINLVDPAIGPAYSVSWQRYRRQHPHPDDFVNGIEARYRWEP